MLYSFCNDCLTWHEENHFCNMLKISISFATTSEDATQTDLAGEQCDNGRVVADEKLNLYQSKERYYRGWHPDDDMFG